MCLTQQDAFVYRNILMVLNAVSPGYILDTGVHAEWHQDLLEFLFTWKVNDSHTYLLHSSEVPRLLQSVRSRLCTTILSWPRWAFAMVFSSHLSSLPPNRNICHFFFFVYSRYSFFLGVFTLTVVSGWNSSPLNINPFESFLISALSVKTLCINYHPTRILLSRHQTILYFLVYLFIVFWTQDQWFRLYCALP